MNQVSICTHQLIMGILQDAVLYQPASKGRNLSLCGLISISGIQHYKLVDGAFNRDRFVEFLTECSQKNVFTPNTILVLDSVRFHHCS